MNPASGMLAHLTNSPQVEIDLLASGEALANSAILGILLMILVAWVSQMTAREKEAVPGEPPLKPSDVVINSANVLFICFGMTGMMLIVNNNIARAFAIAAAIALVRFKIKVNSKVTSMGMFYGVLVGMACGVGHSFIGYALVLFFGVLQLFVVYAIRFTRKRFGDTPIQSPASSNLLAQETPVLSGASVMPSIASLNPQK